MVDPVGTAIGVVALFSTCLEGWHLIEDGLSMGRDFVIQRQRYLNLRLRFVLWGEACGLNICNHSDDGFIPRSIRSNVLDTLGCIANLFKDGDKLKHRYGLDTDTNSSPHPERSNPAETSMLQLLTDQYNCFEQRMKQVKGHTGRLGTIRWAISDKPRFATLINHLGELVADLETLTQGLRVRQTQRQLADREMEEIIDLPELHIIEEAGLKDNDPISDAASARISILCSQPSKPSNSSYHTACSNCPNDEPVAIEPSESAPSLFYDSQWQRILASLRTGMPSSKQGIPVDESTSGDLLLRAKARHLLSALPISSLRRRRRVCEIRDVASVIVPWVDGWPIGDDCRDFITAIEGPLGTPYEGSVFYLRITLPEDHPYKPPDCRFLTKVYHPNINSFGQICSDLFDTGWSPTFTLTSILVAICGLLTTPNIEDPLVPEIATVYVEEPQTYEQYARKYAEKHANPRLYPVIDSNGTITFQMCDRSLEELVCCLSHRAVDDAFMLEKKYRRHIRAFPERSEFFPYPKIERPYLTPINLAKDDPLLSQAEGQLCEDIISLSQKTAMFFQLVKFDELRHDKLQRCVLLLKHSLSWLEDLLLKTHTTWRPPEEIILGVKLRHDISENTAWLIWALNDNLINFEKLLSSETSEVLEC